MRVHHVILCTPLCGFMFLKIKSLHVRQCRSSGYKPGFRLLNKKGPSQTARPKNSQAEMWGRGTSSPHILLSIHFVSFRWLKPRVIMPFPSVGPATLTQSLSLSLESQV